MPKAHLAMGVIVVGAAILVGSLITGQNTDSDPINGDQVTAAAQATQAQPPVTPKKVATPDATVPKPVPKPQPKEFQGELQAKQTVGAALRRSGLSPRQVAQIVSALKGIFDFRLARKGNQYSGTLSPDGKTVRHFRFEHTPVDIYEVNLDEAGSLIGQKIEVKLDVLTATMGAEIKGSLYASITASGESPALVSRIVDVFAWDIDFYKDTQPGDRFKLIFEKKFKGEAFIGYGRILAAEYEGKAGKFQSFWYQHPKAKSGDYFLADGRSARKMFLATPLKFTRISSGFNPKRKHPILGYTKAHLAIDYAAPIGTPVWSMADGKVTYVGRLGAAGKIVRIKHRNRLTSSYAHLSRYARGLKRGMRVKQKQIIGYVGMTGRTTGPHLHFTVRRGRRFVNPLKLKMTREKSVPKRYRKDFKSFSAQRQKELDAIVIVARGTRKKP